MREHEHGRRHSVTGQGEGRREEEGGGRKEGRKEGRKGGREGGREGGRVSMYLDDGAHATEGCALEGLAPVERVTILEQTHIVTRDGLDQVLGCVLEGGREGG